MTRVVCEQMKRCKRHSHQHFRLRAALNPAFSNVAAIAIASCNAHETNSAGSCNTVTSRHNCTYLTTVPFVVGPFCLVRLSLS